MYHAANPNKPMIAVGSQASLHLRAKMAEATNRAVAIEKNILLTQIDGWKREEEKEEEEEEEEEMG
jgi:hypothetical protein